MVCWSYRRVQTCLGTYYYNRGKSWDYLDTIMATRDRGIQFNKDSIDVFINDLNSYKEHWKPHWFDPETKRGVSDHFPIVGRNIFELIRLFSPAASVKDS